MASVIRIDDCNPIGCSIWGELSSLKSAIIDVTTKCNLFCKYCNVDAGNEASKDMDINFFISIVDQLANLGIFQLRISGGEPLLRSDICSLITYAAKRGIDIWLLSNGLSLSRKKAAELASAGLNGVRISVDSSRPHVHDDIRGMVGSWRKAIEALQYCRDEGLQTVLGMTIINKNVMDIETTRFLAESIGARFATCNLMPFGRAEEHIKEIGELKIDGILRATLATTGAKSCNAVTDNISINVDGEISACTFSMPVLSLKNISLKDALNHPSLLKYKYAIPNSEKCKKCNFKTPKGLCLNSRICRGGCWAMEDAKCNQKQIHCTSEV